MIFDGHNDVLTSLREAGGVGAAGGFATGLPGHVDAAKLRAGGMFGGFFAIWCASPDSLGDVMAMMRAPEYAVPLPPLLDPAEAMAQVLEEAAILKRLEAEGALTICRSAAEIEAVRDAGGIAAIMHLEGAECIGPDLTELDALYALGLRSLGPVWSRPTIFAHGAPFAFPSSPDVGPGLTEAGRALIARCAELRMVVDLSHMNEAGFRDVAAMAVTPLVATHSNAHALTPHARNLTDDQLRMIGDTGGVAGLNFATAMLRDDGRMVAELALDRMLAHLGHMIDKAGEGSVALGSDFDGATMPSDVADAAALPALVAAMEGAGWRHTRIEAVCAGNWLRLLRDVWGG